VWAAFAVWLLVAYPLSIGPAAYCAGRGWIEPGGQALVAFYRPLVGPPLRLGGPDVLGRFTATCFARGREHRHAASD